MTNDETTQARLFDTEDLPLFSQTPPRKTGDKPARRPAHLDTPTQHRLIIARKTLFELSDIGAALLGGMTKAEAREVINQYGSQSDRRRLEEIDRQS